MDKVKDLILYQVATNRNYKVGETFVFDKNTKNGQYEKVFNSSFIDGNTRFCDKRIDAVNSGCEILCGRKGKSRTGCILYLDY